MNLVVNLLLLATCCNAVVSFAIVECNMLRFLCNNRKLSNMMKNIHEAKML